MEFRRALLVNPYDPESVAGAIAQALAMPIEERRARHQALLAAVLDYDVDRWQREFLASLRGEDDITSTFPLPGPKLRPQRQRSKTADSSAMTARANSAR